jgi:hypothetical protein
VSSEQMTQEPQDAAAQVTADPAPSAPGEDFAPAADLTKVPHSDESPITTQADPSPAADATEEDDCSTGGASSAEAVLRARLTAQFEQWLDRMLAGEPPPQGLPPELLEEIQSAAPQGQAQSREDCDLYSLFSALTTLSGEIRLQGRAFKQLSDAIAPVPARLQDLESSQAQAAHALDALRADEALNADDLPASGKEICQLLIDLYDRLERGVRTCNQTITSLTSRRPGALARLLGAAQATDQAAASAQAIRDASALTLARLESALHDWGIERIGNAGETFDPRRMTAVQAKAASEEEPGTVLEVNRSGYALRGQMKQTAQVTVAT